MTVSPPSNPKTVFITGASSGIGAALAKEYSHQGFNLVLCARREDRLQEVIKECSGSKAVAVRCDVTKPEDLQRAVAAGLQKFGAIDVVIANAGFGIHGPIHRLEIEDYRRQFETNVFGVLHTIKATLSSLKESKGRLAIMGSMNSYVSTAITSPYTMSKFAVRALADSLFYELKPSGVSTTLICPGFIESEIRRVDKFGKFHSEARDRAPKKMVMPAEVAAKHMFRAIDKRKREIVVTGHAKFVVFVQRHFPWLLGPIMSMMVPKRKKSTK